MSSEFLMYVNMVLFLIGNVYIAYSRSVSFHESVQEIKEKEQARKEGKKAKEEAEHESLLAKSKDWESRIEELKQNIEKENAEMDHLVFLSSLTLASMVGGATMANLLAKDSNKSRHDMDEFIRVQKERELHRCMLDVMDMPKKQDRIKKGNRNRVVARGSFPVVDLTQRKVPGSQTLVLPGDNRIRISNDDAFTLRFGSVTDKAKILRNLYFACGLCSAESFIYDNDCLVYFYEEDTFYYTEVHYQTFHLNVSYKDARYAMPANTIREMIVSKVLEDFTEPDFTKAEYDSSTHTYYLFDKVEYESPRARVKNNPLTNQAVYNLIQEFRQYPLTAVERSLYAAEVGNIKEGSRTIDQSIIIDNIRKKYDINREDDRSNEDMAMMNKNSPGRRPASYDEEKELTSKDKLKQHDTYNGYYPNIKKVDLTQPIRFKKISLVINRYLTIPISEVTKDSLMGGDQSHFECLLAIYRIDKNNKYNIPSHIDVNNLRFFYEESRILCVDEDDLDTRVVKVKVQGATISLPSASTRKNIVESISLIYPYVDFTNAYYDSDAHMYDFDSTNLMLKSKKKLSDDELNKALLQEEFSTTFKQIYGDAVESVSECVSSSRFVDNIKADIIDANSFFPEEHVYPLRFPRSQEKEKEVVAREWFLGIEETEQELKARYKKQENAIAGWDDF